MTVLVIQHGLPCPQSALWTYQDALPRELLAETASPHLLHPSHRQMKRTEKAQAPLVFHPAVYMREQEQF